MLKKIFNGSSSSITSAAVIIGAAALVSRLLGVIRDRILASQFGAGATLDMYYAAFRLPDLVYNLLVLGALSAGFIPVFVKYLKNGQEWRLASAVLNLVVTTLLLLGAVLFIFTPALTDLIAPGFSGSARATTVGLTRIMFLSPLFLGVSAIWGGILQSQKKFLVYSLAPIFYNLGIMMGALFFVDWWGINGLAWGVVLGSALHMLVQLPAVVSAGFVYQPVWGWREAGVREIVRLMVPRTLALALSQVNLLVINIIASTLAVGSLAVFNLANNLQSFPVGIFAISFAIAVFPTLSACWANNDRSGFVTNFSQTIRQILFFIIPASALLIVLRAQIVRVILGAGQFDWTDTVLTADTLALFCLGLFAQALIPVLARAFYALSNTLIPLFAGLIAAAVNLALALYLVDQSVKIMTLEIGGVAGLALAFSLSSIVNLVLLWVALRLKVGNLDEKRILISLFKISLATLFLGLTAQSLKSIIEPYTGTTTFLGIFGQGALAGLAGLAVFAVASWFLRSEEMLTFVHSLKRRLLRKETVPTLEDGV